jgi:hypothetical protein
MDEKFLEQSIEMLSRKGLKYDTEIINSKTYIYIYLDRETNIEKLIEIWAILDKLDWEIWKGWNCGVDAYMVGAFNVVEFSVISKKAYSTTPYNYNPPLYTTPTTTKKPSSLKNYTLPTKQGTSHRLEITSQEKNNLELSSIREAFDANQIDSLDKNFSEIFQDDLDGPFSYKTNDYVYWRIKEDPFVKSIIRLEKFRGNLYIVTLSFYPNYSLSARTFKCNSISDIDALIKDIYNWLPF